MNDQPTTPPPQPETSDQPDVTTPSQPVETSPLEDNDTQLGRSITDMSSAQPAPPKSPRKLSKKLIAVFIGVGVLVVLAIVAIVLYLVFFYISKADYKYAEAQTNTATITYNKVEATSDSYSEAASDESATDVEIANRRADYETAKAAYQSATKALSSVRALKNDKVKIAHDSFVAKNKDYMANNDTMEQSMPTLRKIAVNCSESKIGAMEADDLSKLVAGYDKAMGPCTSAMKELSVSKNADAATLGKKVVEYLTDMRTHVVAMQTSYVANDRTTFEKEYNAFTASAGPFSTGIDTSNLQKHQDSLSPETELKHLTSVIKPLE